MKKNMNPYIENCKKVVELHKVSEGAYARWLRDDGSGRNLGVSEYGCADAANILYTIGDFPTEPEERNAWICTLQNLQDSKTGMFVEATHYPLHTTAHCLAALELFDARPKYKLTALSAYMTKDGLNRFMEELEWLDDPWDASHKGAGLYAALNLAGEANSEWNNRYFQWLWEEADPASGMWRKGCVQAGEAPIVAHMAGTFHYLFNHEYAKMPLRYPSKLIDSCLNLYYQGLSEHLGHCLGFTEVDWVFCITRARRQCGHRYEECQAALRDFANKYTEYLLHLNPYEDMDDLHGVFGSLCCVAELQNALPGEIITDKPLKLVLDRRPFI